MTLSGSRADPIHASQHQICPPTAAGDPAVLQTPLLPQCLCSAPITSPPATAALAATCSCYLRPSLVVELTAECNSWLSGDLQSRDISIKVWFRD